MISDQGRYERFWGVIPLRLLHPKQLLIIEAIGWVGQPLSATQIKTIYASGRHVSSYHYHCKRLVELGLLEAAGSVERRGGWENSYSLKVD